MDKDLELKKIERDLLDGEIELMLLKFEKEIISGLSVAAKSPNSKVYARKIVAYLREHLVK